MGGKKIMLGYKIMRLSKATVINIEELEELEE